jgi:hypothetical protein
MFVAFALVVAMLAWKAGGMKTSRQAGRSTGAHPEPVPGRSPWYQVLGTWTAIFASLAAVGGLVFTASSVRYQAQQTGLQAAASRTQADQQNKQQAQLVNTWAASEFSPDRILVTVSNRSEEPVYQFRLYIAFATSGSRGYLSASTWASFPPCTQITFDLRAIAESYVETAHLILPSRVSDFDYGIMFKDAAGQAWHRHASGMLHPTPWLEYLSQPGTFSPLLPPVFRSFTPLAIDQFTTPEPHGRFISAGPAPANSCGQGA